MNNKFEKGSSNLVFQQGDALSQEDFSQMVLQIVLRHRWTILGVTVLFLVTAFLYLLKATPIYTSASRIYVEQSGPKIISEFDGVMTRSGNYLYTEGELLKSTPIVADVVDHAEIKQLKTFANVDNLAAYVKKNLTVNIGRRDDIITVSFNSPYPAEAAQIVNAVTASYVNYHSARKRSTASEVLRILQKEKVKRDEELLGKFAEMLEFTRKNEVVSFDNRGGNVVFERLTKLSDALTEAQLVALNAKADFEAAKSMENEPAKIRQFATASASVGNRVFVSDNETQLRSEQRQAEMELEDARYYCTEDHPSIQAIHTKIDRIKQELERQTKEFADAYIEVIRLRWVTAKQREDELQVSFDDQYRAARDLGVKAAEYSVLQSELNRAERTCEILDNRIKELNVTEDVGALNISILEVARPAQTPSEPQKCRIMAISLALGLTIGVCLAVFQNSLDSRLRSADEISLILGIPILGVIPTMSNGKDTMSSGHKIRSLLKSIVTGGRQRKRTTISSGTIHSKSLSAQDDDKAIEESNSIMERARKVRSELQSTRWTQRMGKKTQGSVWTTTSDDKTKSKIKTAFIELPIAPKGKISSEKPDVVRRGQKAYLEPKSVVAEAYRTVRTAVFFGVHYEKAKTILITSPAPGDGKSTVASNLAITMAQAGQKTLLLDADFRKPMQHNIFQIDSREKGLSNLLAGAVNLENAVRPGPVENLDILCCGVDVPNPSEVLNSNSFAEVLEKFSERYDRVVIDSPPVGLVADSQILSALCKVTLLVLRAEKSTRRHSQQARDSILSVGGHILGVIVNDVSRKQGRYGYYSSYGSYGGYKYYGHSGTAEKKKQLAV
jgi:capsular exopolysaccharide synthesis family protein